MKLVFHLTSTIVDVRGLKVKLRLVDEMVHYNQLEHGYAKSAVFWATQENFLISQIFGQILEPIQPPGQ